MGWLFQMQAFASPPSLVFQCRMAGGKRPALSDIATHSTALGIQSKPEVAATTPAALTGSACQRFGASQVQTTSGISVSKPFPASLRQLTIGDTD